MKKGIRIALIAILALAVLAAAALVVNRVVYGRSIQATVYEQILRRRNADYNTPEEETERLERRREKGEQPYTLAKNVQLQAELAETSRCGMQVFTLNPGGGQATVVYLHGGAYVNSFNVYQWRLMNRLATEAGLEVVAPAYHLAPFGDCERGVEDIAALWRELKAEMPDRRMVLMGDSAGGGLALAAAEALVASGDALPDRLILFSPWVDVSGDNPDMQRLIAVEPMLHPELMKLHGQYWAGEAGVYSWKASPLFGEMAGLPPVTLYFGTRELLYPDLLLLQEKLREAGVDAQVHVGNGLNHDFPLMPIPEANAAFRDIAAQALGA